MSVILEALKKVEKERSQKNSTSSSSQASLVVQKKKGSFSRILFLAVFAFLAGGVLFLIRSKQISLFSSSEVPTIVTPVSQTQPQVQVPIPPIELDPQILLNEALNLYERGDYQGSRKKWEAFIQKNPQSAEAFNNLGLVLKRMGETKEAYQAYNQALNLKPDYPEALHNLGTLLLEILQKDGNAAFSQLEITFSGTPEQEIARLFSKALSLKPDYAEAHLHLGLLEEKRGNLKEALLHYEEGLKNSPTMEEALKGNIQRHIFQIQKRLKKAG